MKVLIYLLIIVFPFSQFTSGQKSSKKIIIAGIVRDIKQNPVEGAVIFVDKAKTNSKTNKQGYYKVKVKPSASEIMVFSVVGGTAVAKITDNKIIDLTLDGEIKPAKTPDEKITENEETVNIGYGNINSKNVTTSVGTAQGQTNSNTEYVNIYDMIRSQVPGVEVVGQRIRIRGTTSINSNMSSEPVYVVDGVTVQTLDNIVPRTVKSIQVLTGASAAIYGFRGANGVIQITRYSGKDKK